MKIIIVGDGKVGYTLADQLSRESHDIVIIDRNEEALRRASDYLDVMCVKGNGASGTVLRDAGVSKTELFIAATSSDELNMLCCLTAKKLGAAHTAARIRDPDYARDINMLKHELGINLVINPEQATASEISRLLRFTSASNIEHFARGRVELISIVIDEDDPLAGVKLSSLRKRLTAGVIFALVERDDEVFIPHGDTELLVEDKVYIIGEPLGLAAFCKNIGMQSVRVKSMMIIGGGRIGRYLAGIMLKLGVSVKIIDNNEAVCESLTEELPNAMVICGDGTDHELLESEDLSSMDAFVSLTGREEDNLLVALYAQRRGVSKVVAKSTRNNYDSLAREMGLSSIVSPKNITAGQIVRYVRGLKNTGGSHLDAMYRIAGGKADVMEFTVGKNVQVIGRMLKTLTIDPNCIIGAIIRNGRVIIPDGNSHLNEGDSVILVTQGLTLSDLEEIFS